MKTIIYFVLWIAAIACSSQSSSSRQEKAQTKTDDRKYVWTKLLDSADWKKSYNFQMLSLRDTLWIFHPDGNWYSADGVAWRKSELSNAIFNLAFLDYVAFNKAVYGLGHFEGNIERFTLKTEIYKTDDFKTWIILSGQSNLPKRFFYHPFVFNNKIWIVGGEDEKEKHADIWNSTDAVTWTKQKDHLNMGKRSGSQIVTFKDKLYLLDNDVWTSSNGLDWSLVTSEIVPGEKIFGYAAVVYDDKIWLLGCNRNGQFSSQVLVSEDGKNWSGQNAPWTPRGGMAAAVHKGKIYMTGGKYGGTPNHPDFRYSNDLWTLERKK